jgi:predicted nucleic acid-binding protein
MTLLVDRSVWSLALRRDTPPAVPEVEALERALAGDELVATTGLILQELLQGFIPAKAQTQIVERFAALNMVQPDRDDHVAAADLRNACRRAGVQIGTIDALIAQLTSRHNLTLLTTDRDFVHATRHCSLRLWAREPRADRI